MKKQYSDCELEAYIKSNCNHLSIKDMIAYTGMGEIDILKKIKKLNFNKKRNFKRFSDEEILILKKYYKYLNDSVFSKLLLRNRSVIHTKLKEMNLTRDDKEIALYKACLDGYEDTIMFLHSSFNLSVNGIYSLIKKNNSKSEITILMIEAFLYSTKLEYEKIWKMYGQDLTEEF